MIDVRRVLHPFWSACYWFPTNIAFGTWCFPEVGTYHTSLGSTVGFLNEPLDPTEGQLQLPPPLPSPPQRNCPTNAQGRRSWLKLTGLLKRGWVKRRRIKGRIRSTELNWPELNKWRQKFRPWRHSRSRGFKWFHWKWLLLVRNELSLIRKTLQRGESLIPSRPLHLWYTWFVTFFSKLKWGLQGKSGPRRVWMLHCVPAIKVLLVNLTFRFRCRYSFLAPWNWF